MPVHSVDARYLGQHQALHIKNEIIQSKANIQKLADLNKIFYFNNLPTTMRTLRIVSLKNVQKYATADVLTLFNMKAGLVNDNVGLQLKFTNVASRTELFILFFLQESTLTELLALSNKNSQIMYFAQCTTGSLFFSRLPLCHKAMRTAFF